MEKHKNKDISKIDRILELEQKAIERFLHDKEFFMHDWMDKEEWDEYQELKKGFNLRDEYGNR